MLMDQWLEQFSQLHPTSKDEAIVAYAESHLSFVSIHPFYDGNGRMARLLSNFPVLQSGFPPIIISNKSRQDYITICSNFQKNGNIFPEKNDCDQFVDFLKKQWASTWDIIYKAYEQQRKRNFYN